MDDFFDNVTASTKLGFDVADGVDLGPDGALVAKPCPRSRAMRSTPSPSRPFPSPAQTRIVRQEVWAARATAHWAASWIDQTLGFAYNSGQSRTADPDNGPSATSGDRIKLDWQGNIRARAKAICWCWARKRHAMRCTCRSAPATPPMPALPRLNSDFGFLQASASRAL